MSSEINTTNTIQTPMLETPAHLIGMGEQVAPNDLEAYLRLRRPDNEPVVQVVGELLDHTEVAPDAWERPGAKALVTAAAEWVLQDPASRDAARGFVAEIVKAEGHDEESLAILGRARQMRSEDHTAAALRWLRGDDPILEAGRERLGITSETERPFEVIVVDRDCGMYDGDQAKQAEWSRSLTGNDTVMPPVFVYKATADTSPIMVLDRATMDILQDPTHHGHRQAAKAVVHEYGHTQRDIKTAGSVGIGLEERMAILVAGGQAAYVETMVYTHILNAVSDQQFGPRFRDAIAGIASMDEVYEIVAASAGPQAAVALAGIPAHARHYELPAYATLMVRDGEAGPMAIYRHLTESVDIARLVSGLGVLDGKVAKWVMNNAEGAGISLHREVLEALTARLEPEDNPDWYRRHYGLSPAS